MIKAITSFFTVSKTAKTLCVALCGLFALLLIAGLLTTLFVYPFEQPLPYFLGLLLGTLSSMLKVVFMEKSIERSLDMESGTVKNYASLMSILRYFLTIAAFLCVIFFKDIFGLFGTVLGTLSLQLAAYIANYMLKNVSPSEL